ncbi:hypothetical protein [Cryptosporangium aurantiacum]|uniref:hypothetical protein n=1 Tax=Cryptosporangium aurantiacum TaxID=134849 RepID=UPI001160F3E9|nr:hypothetical protein [Cryptosporangium aurantiacum]
MSRSDQATVAMVVVVVGILVALSLRGTRPGAPARMGAIVAGIVLLLALMVGLRAHDLTKPRSADRPTPAALRPTTAQAFGDATVSGDPQSGLTVNAPAATGGAYLSDAEFCDGRLEASVHVKDVRQSTTRAATEVAAVEPPASGLLLGIRAGSDPTVPAALSIEYSRVDEQVRVADARGTTLAVLASAEENPRIRVDLAGARARVWFDGQPLPDGGVPLAGGCGAVRFSAWGTDAVLRDLVIRPAG